MLDNAMFKELAAKKGDVRRQAGSGCSPQSDVRRERTAGVPSLRSGPHIGQVSKPSTG